MTTYINTCSRCLGPLQDPDGALTMKHDTRYGHFGKSLCAMSIEDHNTVARLQLEGGRV